jgi:hypothetical protein
MSCVVGEHDHANDLDVVRRAENVYDRLVWWIQAVVLWVVCGGGITAILGERDGGSMTHEGDLDIAMEEMASEGGRPLCARQTHMILS